MMHEGPWADGAATPKDDVHLGTWINWSRGPVMGATLTLNGREGKLLIAFTAVFISVATGRLWRIASILFYRHYSSPKPDDGLYHQQQAILRNSSSTFSAIWTFSQLLWTWRNIAKHCFVRVLPTLLTAIFCLSAFTIAGGFSSSISSGISDEVLLNGANCGSTFYDSDPFAMDIMRPHISQISHSAANYAQQCYSPNSTGISDSAGIFDCNYFVRDHLRSTVDSQAACPFHNSSICRSNSSNIRLDTGYISLLNDLGINAPLDQDILFRKVLHCAPLETQSYAEPMKGVLDNFTIYNYGPFARNYNLSYTYMIESLDSQYNKQLENPYHGRGNSFIINTKTALAYNGKPDNPFDEELDPNPIPALFRPDADTILIFLSGNGISFLERTNDPWYRATIPGEEIHSPNTEEVLFTLYQPEEAASPMGCTEQLQFCNSSLSKSRCGPLASWWDAVSQSAPLFGMTSADFMNNTMEPNATMISRYDWLVGILSDVALYTDLLVSALGQDSLGSLKYLTDGLMGSLPDNQWQLDVEYWWAISLASLQATMVDTARGSTDPVLEPYTVRPYTSDIWAMCNNQKIRSTRHVSFSLFGLYFTFVTGLLIIVISFALEPIFKCLYRRRKYKQHTYLEWAASETLQLQRIGFQGVNAGSWSGCTDAIPTTKPGDILPSLARVYSSDTESTIAAGGTPEEASNNSAAASSGASWNQEADLVSLDSLLDDSADSTVGSPVTQADGDPDQIDHTYQRRYNRDS